MPVSYHFILCEHNAFMILAEYLIDLFFLNQRESIFKYFIVSFCIVRELIKVI